MTALPDSMTAIAIADKGGPEVLAAGDSCRCRSPARGRC